jgi:putative phosphoesterase
LADGMKVGVLADVHANQVALDAVLADLPAVDALVCAGDVVGYNPWPAECVAALRERAVPTVMGNHDRAVAGGGDFRFNSMASAGVRHARDELSAAGLEWLAGLPAERREFEGRVKLVHGHPDDPDRYTYPAEFGPGLLGDEDVLVMGHTHVQHAETYDDGIVVNPGSVGQPRDGDPRAGYAVLDLDALTVEPRRVEYDVERVVDAVAAAGLPERIGTRLRRGE